MRSGPARKAMERLKKYMVLKRHHAEQMIDLIDSADILRTDEDVRAVRNRVKAIRQQGVGVLPNFPARKWLAGYADGDGSFAVKVCSKTGYAYPKLSIMAAPNYTAGIQLIKKCFGGRIGRQGDNFMYSIELSQPSKATEFLGYSPSIYTSRKGKPIFFWGVPRVGTSETEDRREAIKALNAQQHRLSDPTSHASRLIDTISFDIEKRPTNWIGRGAMKRRRTYTLCRPRKILPCERVSLKFPIRIMKVKLSRKATR